MGQRGNDSLYNLISLFFIVLSVMACLIALLIMGNVVTAGPFEPATDVPPGTLLAGIPSLTPSHTPPPSITPAPSNTPLITATWTPFPSQTPTDTPPFTSTPSPTITLTFTPSSTPSDTPTPTETLTPTGLPTETFTPSPTGPTLVPTSTVSPFPLVVDAGTPLFRDAYLYPGCNWQGLAGQIRGQDGAPLIGLTIQVTGDNISTIRQTSGTNTNYGLSGWEVKLGDGISASRYRIQVYSSDGVTALSPPIELVFPNNCQQNLALINFVQVRDLEGS